MACTWLPFALPSLCHLLVIGRSGGAAFRNRPPSSEGISPRNWVGSTRRFRLVADYDFFARALDRETPMYATQTLARFRLHSSNLSKNHSTMETEARLVSDAVANELSPKIGPSHGHQTSGQSLESWVGRRQAHGPGDLLANLRPEDARNDDQGGYPLPPRFSDSLMQPIHPLPREARGRFPREASNAAVVASDHPRCLLRKRSRSRPNSHRK